MGLPPTALLLPHACFADSYAPYVRDRFSRDGQLGPIVGVEPRYRRYAGKKPNKNKLRDKRLDKRQDDCLSSQVPAGNDRSDVPKCGGISYHL